MYVATNQTTTPTKQWSKQHMKAHQQGNSDFVFKILKWSSLGRFLAVAAWLMVALPFLSFGDQSPPNCAGTGGSQDLLIYRADQVTRIQQQDPISPCETVFYQAQIGHSADSTVCDFEGATFWTITTPDGVVHDALP